MNKNGDDRLWFPATERNREPLAAVLEPLLPRAGLVLEIASGSGEHLCYLQQRFGGSHPELHWQGSDPDPTHRASLAAWGRHFGLKNMLPPLNIDTSSKSWPALTEPLQMLLCINMIHIAPWAATEGLLANGAKLLSAGALLVLYGPFREEGKATSPSNEAFDASLKQRNPAWGLRRLEVLNKLALQYQLEQIGCWQMPANNLTVAYQRS